jgi:hypothetical protein
MGSGLTIASITRSRKRTYDAASCLEGQDEEDKERRGTKLSLRCMFENYIMLHLEVFDPLLMVIPG